MKKLLIVDDNRKFRELGQKTIKNLGYKVDTACDYEEGIKKVKESLKESKPYDFVLTDLYMPESQNKKYDQKTLKLIERISAVAVVIEPCRHPVKTTTRIFEEKKQLLLDDDSYYPLGLALLGFLYAKNIPSLIFTQGDRHYGAFGRIRYSLEYCLPEKIVIYYFCVGEGYGDKKKCQDWKKSLQELDDLKMCMMGKGDRWKQKWVKSIARKFNLEKLV